MATWDFIEWNNSKVYYCSVHEHSIHASSSSSSSNPSSSQRIDTEYDFQDHTGFVLWRPCAITLSRLLLSTPGIVQNKRIMELGAGVGLPSAVVAYLIKKTAAAASSTSTITTSSFILATDAMRPTLCIAHSNIEYNLSSSHDTLTSPPSPEESMKIGKEDDNLFPFAARLRWAKKLEMLKIMEYYKPAIYRSADDYGFDLFLASDVLWLRPYVEENIYDQAKQLFRTVYYLMTKARKRKTNALTSNKKDDTTSIPSTTTSSTGTGTINNPNESTSADPPHKERTNDTCVWKIPSKKRYNFQKTKHYLLKIFDNSTGSAVSSLSRASSLSSFPSGTNTSTNSSLASSPLTIPSVNEPVAFGENEVSRSSPSLSSESAVITRTPTEPACSSLPMIQPSTYCPLLLLSYQCRLDGMTQDIMNAAERTGFDIGILSTLPYRTVKEQQTTIIDDDGGKAQPSFPLVHIVLLSPCTACLDRFIKDQQWIRLNPVKVSTHDQHYRERSESSSYFRAARYYGYTNSANSNSNLNDSSSTEGEYSNTSSASNEDGSTNDDEPGLEGSSAVTQGKSSITDRSTKTKQKKKKPVPHLPNCHHTNPLFRNKK